MAVGVVDTDVGLCTKKYLRIQILNELCTLSLTF